MKQPLRLLQISSRGDAGATRGELVPLARLSGPIPWVIAIMVALTAIASAGGLALRNVASAAASELSDGITVQIVEARPEVRDAAAKAAVALLQSEPGVTGVRPVPQADVDALIEPWLGVGAADGGAEEAAVPVPALIDARLTGRITPERLAALRDRLRAQVPSARVDAQSSWLKPVFGAISSLQWLALALVLLMGLATGSAVLLATRTALGSNRETIEIVHLLGGTDAQIARIFQRAIATDAASGGATGFVAAAIVIVLLGRRFAGLGAGLVSGGTLGWLDWALLALVPLAGTLLATMTARFTVLRALARML
ncbi:MAG: cell division protein [Novosphingobium sp.]